MNDAVQNVINRVESKSSLERSLVDWRPILAKECQVYVFEEQYLAKRFDQINYKFTNIDEAKEILVDNLYSLLRFKYFPKINDDIDKRINEIVKSFTNNLKTTLIRVSLDKDSNCEHIQFLKDSQVAFRNGVFDFKTNTWLFKYEVIKIENLHNNIYMYDPQYIIQWYFNFDFNPLEEVDVNKMPLEDFIYLMKDTVVDVDNVCFKLMYNIAHDVSDVFSIKKFTHLCEIIGFTLMQSFSQNFVLLIGSGQNGKNSLFDGCFSNRVVPRPAAISMDDIENDRFVTGSLENKSHNIFLETSAKTYTESKYIKALTGSMFQTIECKGVNKYSGLINCKYIFAGNDQSKIKFNDTTNGFRRRINILEIFYQWDKEGRYLKRGDYYNISFSDDLHELKEDITNTIIYIYFAMYGILSATKNFTRNFEFSYNDWRMTYADIDFDLKDRIENITPESIASYISFTPQNYEECKTLFYDTDKFRLQESPTIKEIGYYNYDDMIRMFNEPEGYMNYFTEHDVYISLPILQKIAKKTEDKYSTFSQAFKKLYSITTLPTLYGNKQYVKITFVNKKLKVIGE